MKEIPLVAIVNANEAYHYARHIIKGRFEPGEAVIKDTFYWKGYCESFGIKE